MDFMVNWSGYPSLDLIIVLFICVLGFQSVSGRVLLELTLLFFRRRNLLGDVSFESSFCFFRVSGGSWCSSFHWLVR